jgi:PAS domain S-box-containing protein
MGGSVLSKSMNVVEPELSQKKSTSHLSRVTSVYDNLPVAVYTCDTMGYVDYYNDAAVKLWGYAPELGTVRWGGAWKVCTKDGVPMTEADCALAATIAKAVPVQGEEIIIIRPDGVKRNVLPYPAPIFNESGELTGAVNTLVDITEEKASESKEAMLAAIIRSSEDAIISKTLAGVITTWNEAAERMYGYTEQEAIGRNIITIIPDDRLDEEVMIISKITRGENVEHFETIRKGKTGELIPVSLTISPIKDSHGVIIGASKIARDISKYKRAEERLQKYTESLELLSQVGQSVNESLEVADILQKVTDVTTQLTGAAFGAFFYNKIDEHGESYMLYTLSGAPKEAFEKFGMPRNTAVFNYTFSGQGIVRSDDITKDPRYGKNPPHYGMPKGHLPVVSYLAVPVVSKSENVIGGLFFGHPEPGKFTREHEQVVSSVVSQAATALDNAKLYEQVKVLNAKKDEFIGLASHELKTPVTSLKGYLQIFEKNIPEDDKNKNYINKAVQQVNKLSGLISDLLDISKIETGKLPLDFTFFDLKLLMKEVIELTQYSSRSHEITLICSEDEVMVKADRQRIEQVIINLISNAIKYSPNANKVAVSLFHSGNRACVTVEDFGIGIDQEQQDRIFSRFYRVDELATHISGLGIGLYISREIINRHNGALKVKSEYGKGSTFSFEIPL